MKKILLFVSLLFLITGCAPKVNIQTLKSSTVTNASSKQLAVLRFYNDDISQADQILSELSKYEISNKPYFTIVDRKNIERILREKELNDSGLVERKDLKYIKGFTQAESFLMGEVSQSTLRKKYFSQLLTDYKKCLTYDNTKKECKIFDTYYQRCQKNTYFVQTNIQLIEIDSSNIIFANTYNESKEITKCGEGILGLPTIDSVNTSLAKNIAQRVLKDIAPSYINFSISILDELDLEVSDSFEEEFESAVKLLSKNRINKALNMFIQLNKKVPSKSYVILYNIALSHEALGQIEEALSLYKKAEDISLSKNIITTEISNSIKRVERTLQEEKKLKNLVY